MRQSSTTIAAQPRSEKSRCTVWVQCLRWHNQRKCHIGQMQEKEAATSVWQCGRNAYALLNTNVHTAALHANGDTTEGKRQAGPSHYDDTHNLVPTQPSRAARRRWVIARRCRRAAMPAASVFVSTCDTFCCCCNAARCASDCKIMHE